MDQGPAPADRPTRAARLESDVRAIAALLCARDGAPATSLDTWMRAIGASAVPQGAARIRMALDALLPGLFAVKRAGPRAGVSLNVASEAKLRGVAACVSAHSVKLGCASARGAVPLDDRREVEGLQNYLGAHQIAAGDVFDYSGNAGDIPLFRQLAHAMGGNGRFATGVLERGALAPEILAQIERIERVAHEALTAPARRAGALSAGVHQLVVPDEHSATGYLSISPVACGAVLAELSEALGLWNEARAAHPIEMPDRPGRVPSARWMAAVSKRQNLSSVVGSVRRVLAGTVPAIEPSIREALSIRTNPAVWARRTSERLAHRNEEYRGSVREFRAQLATVLRSGKEGVSMSARGRLAAVTDRVVFPLAWRWIDLAWARPELFAGTPWAPEAFDRGAAAQALALVLKVEADSDQVRVSPAVIDHWCIRAEEVIERVIRTVQKRRQDVAVDLA